MTCEEIGWFSFVNVGIDTAFVQHTDLFLSGKKMDAFM